MNFQGNSWNINSEFAYNKPPEYGVEFSGVRTLSLNIIRDIWSLDAGHLTAVFGNGLAFNFFEDKSLDFDNRPFGLRMDVELNDQFQLMSLIGTRSEFSSYSGATLKDPDLFANYDVGGIQLNYFPEYGDWNGAGYITGSKFRSPVRIDKLDTDNLDTGTHSSFYDTYDTYPEQEAFIFNSGITYTLYRENWEWSLEYGTLKKWYDIPLVEQDFNGTVLKTVESITEELGNVFYSQLTGTLPDYSTLTFEYKLYRNGIESPENRLLPNRMASKSMPFHLGPTLLRQHDVGLLANLTHVVDYGDESGFNIDYRKNLGDEFSITGIYAQASRTSNDGKGGGSFFPSMGLDHFPFQELYLEMDYSGYILQNRVIGAYTEFSLDGEKKEKYITLIPAYFSRISGPFVLGGSLGIQKAFKSGNEYLNQQYILSADWKRKFSIALITDITSDPDTKGNTQWISGEIGYKPSPVLTILTSYGTEKGGIRCTGGVCRSISPFDGVRITLEARI